MKINDYPPVSKTFVGRKMTVADMLCIIASELFIAKENFEGIRLVNIANGTADEYETAEEMIADSWDGMRKVILLYRHIYEEYGQEGQYYICIYDQIEEEED